jgi:uncharacterized membrane protein YhaH (DUF805 family)
MNSDVAFFCGHLKTAFKKYASFKGTASHQEFWSWVAFAGLIEGLLLSLVYFVEKPVFTYVLCAVTALLVLPSLAVTVRRLHDTGRSGWWILLWGFVLTGTVLFGFLSGYLLQGMSPGDTVTPFTSVFFPVLTVIACIYSLLIVFWLACPGKA